MNSSSLTAGRPGRRTGPGRARAGLVAATALALVALPVGRGAPAHAAPAPAASTAHPPRAVTLPTGDRLAVTTDRAGHTLITTPAGKDGAYLTEQQGGDEFVIPVAALRYVGRQVDRGLFDVTALLRDGHADRIPVTLSVADGSGRPSVPGVTVTGSRGGNTWQGYLTPAGARTFGTALRRRTSADRGSRHDLFGSVREIRYAGSRPAGVTGDRVHPDFPMRTVAITALDQDGAPLTTPYAQLTVINTDDSRKYLDYPQVVDGQARISVPDGHYSAMLFVPQRDGGTLRSVRIVFDDFTVAGAPTSTTLDLRRAVHKVSVDTPKPAKELDREITWYRGSSDTEGTALRLATSPVVPTYLSGSPDGPGVQRFSVHSHLEPRADTAAPYAYDVEFPTDGPVPADQHYRVTPDSLATVDVRYHGDVSRTGFSTWFGLLPWETGQMRAAFPVAQPARRTVYLTGDPTIAYSHDTSEDTTQPVGEEAWRSGARRYHAGGHSVENWFAGPVAAGFPADTGIGQYLCTACRTGDTLTLYPAPVTDSVPDHYGMPFVTGDGFDVGSRFQLYRGDTKLADLTDPGFTTTDVEVPAAPARYRLVYDQHRTVPWTRQSTRSHTEWTFRSQHSDTTTVPDRWYCNAGKQGCSPVSLLTLNYRLDQGLDGRVRPGPARLVLTVGHTAGAPAVPISRADVRYSLDGGTTWRHAPTVPLGGGTYLATWPDPPGASVTLKVSATDRAGNTVDQVVDDAVAVADSDH